MMLGGQSSVPTWCSLHLSLEPKYTLHHYCTHVTISQWITQGLVSPHPAQLFTFLLQMTSKYKGKDSFLITTGHRHPSDRGTIMNMSDGFPLLYRVMMREEPGEWHKISNPHQQPSDSSITVPWRHRAAFKLHLQSTEEIKLAYLLSCQFEKQITYISTLYF